MTAALQPSPASSTGSRPRSLGSPGMDSGPCSPALILPALGCEPAASPLTSGTSAQPLLAAGREPLCAKLTFPPSYQEEDFVREHSIRLFRDLLGKTAWKDKKGMKENAWKVLVRLLLHMSDQAPSVAKVPMSRLSTDQERRG